MLVPEARSPPRPSTRPPRTTTPGQETPEPQMGASCSPHTHPTNCQLMPVGPWGWALSGRACLEIPLIPGATQEAELEGHGTSLQAGWTDGQLGGKTQPEGPRRPPDQEAQPTPVRTECGPFACRQTAGPGATNGWCPSGKQKHKEGAETDGQIPDTQSESGAQTDRETDGRQADKQGRQEGRHTEGHMGGVPGTLSGYEVV